MADHISKLDSDPEVHPTDIFSEAKQEPTSPPQQQQVLDIFEQHLESSSDEDFSPSEEHKGATLTSSKSLPSKLLEAITQDNAQMFSQLLTLNEMILEETYKQFSEEQQKEVSLDAFKQPGMVFSRKLEDGFTLLHKIALYGAHQTLDVLMSKIVDWSQLNPNTVFG